jgi:folate-binding Fe-S cluster repair protein YgfZ
MTRDDIIRMAKEAGLCDADGKDSDSIVITSHLEQFANLVAAAEREAIASILDEYDHKVAPSLMAKAIRARGQE